MEGSVFRAASLCFLFVNEISREPLNRFAPNSYGRRVRSLARTSLKVKIKGQGHQGQNGIFRPFRRPVCGLYLVKAKFHYPSWLEAGRRQVRSLSATSSEPASVMEFGREPASWC